MVENQLTEDQRKGRARTRAFKRLREEFSDTWHELLGEEMALEGLTYTPPKSEKQKAREELQRLLEAYPDLLPWGQALSLDKGDLPEASPLPERAPAAPGDPLVQGGVDPADDIESNDYADPDEPR